MRSGRGRGETHRNVRSSSPPSCTTPAPSSCSRSVVWVHEMPLKVLQTPPMRMRDVGLSVPPAPSIENPRNPGVPAHAMPPKHYAPSAPATCFLRLQSRGVWRAFAKSRLAVNRVWGRKSMDSTLFERISRSDFGASDGRRALPWMRRCLVHEGEVSGALLRVARANTYLGVSAVPPMKRVRSYRSRGPHGSQTTFPESQHVGLPGPAISSRLAEVGEKTKTNEIARF